MGVKINETVLTLLSIVSICLANKISINYNYRDHIHVISLRASTLSVTEYGSTQPLVSMEIDDTDVKQLATFVDEEGTLRILLANPTRVNGTSMYSIDKNGTIGDSQSINSQYVESIRIWKLELNMGWQLALANQPDYQVAIAKAKDKPQHRLPQLRPFLMLYSWRPSYFDSYQTITLEQDGRVNKLQPLHLNGHEFLIVAMGPHRSSGYPIRGDNRVDTLIYTLDFGDGTLRWILHQRLDTKVALDVSSFAVTHQGSLMRDYYVAMIARLPDQHLSDYANYDQQQKSADRLGLVIYKYFGDKFYITNSIEVHDAAKLDTISYGSGDSYVIIAIAAAWSHQVRLYRFDGLELRLLDTPQRRPKLVPSQPLAELSSYTRQRRAMADDGPDIHLFLGPQIAPPSDEQTLNATTKRTIANYTSQQQFRTPTLVVSDLGQSDNTSDALTSSPYQITPIDTTSLSDGANETELNATSTNYNKRGYIDAGQDLLDWCKSRLNSLMGDSFDQLGMKIHGLPNVNQQRPIEIFGDLVIEDSLQVSNMLYAKQVVEANVGDQVDGSGMDFSKTFDEIQATQREIDQVYREVNDILVDDGTPQDVYNSISFDVLRINCSNSMDSRQRINPYFAPRYCTPTVNQLNTIYLNGRDVKDIRRQALLTGRGMTIDREVRFEHLILRGSTNIFGTLNGIPIQDIVFKRGPSSGPISAPKKLTQGLYSTSNLLVGDWDGLSLTRDTILTSTGEQQLSTSVKFRDVIIDRGINMWPNGMLNHNQSSRIERLNGLHLDSHLSQISVANYDNRFNVPLSFDELILNGPIYFGPNATLASTNLQDLWDNAMFSHKHQNISAPIEFAGNVEILPGNDINVDGSINGRILNARAVVMRDQFFRFQNPVVFDDIDAYDIRVEKSLNGVNVVTGSDSQKPELSILYDGDTQILMGAKVFNNIILDGNSTIRGPINGQLDLLRLYSLANNHAEPFKFGNTTLTGNIRVANDTPMHVDVMINGISTDELCSLAISASNNTQTRQYNRLRFEQPIRFKSLRCAAVNGFNNLSSMFLTRHGYQNIPGSLRLTNGAVFNTTVAIGSTFNNMDVTSLSRAVSQVIQETKTGHKSHYGDLFLDELNAAQINSLTLSNVFISRSDNPQVIRAKMIFDHLDIENVLSIGNDLKTNRFNQLNVSELFINTLQYDTPQTIYNHVELDVLHTTPDSNLITSNINGIDLWKFNNDAVRVDTQQQIVAPKTFRGPVELMDHSHLSFGIDGIAESEFKTYLLLHSDEMVDDDLEFSNDVTVKKELEIVSGIINDIDVNQFVENMLYEDRPNKAMRINGNGSVRLNDVKLNNLVVAGTVQGLDLSRDAIMRGELESSINREKQREQQQYNTNARMLNSLQLSGSTFNVATRYLGEDLRGVCSVHSCPRTTPMQSPPPSASPRPYTQPPQPYTMGPTPPTRIHATPSPRPMQSPPRPLPAPLPVQQGQPPTVYPSTVRPPMSYTAVVSIPPPPPTKYFNQSDFTGPVWRPLHGPAPKQAFVAQPRPGNVSYPMIQQHDGSQELIDSRYREWILRNKAEAMRNLLYRINRYIAISFYYEIAQKHPLFGPVLHAPDNPIVSEEGSPLLLLRATGKLGQPCSTKKQTIAVMAHQRQRNPIAEFTQNSVIQETSNPRYADSLVIGQAHQPSHYLFILDFNPDLSPAGTMSQVLIYRWYYNSGRYEIEERVLIDGFPTSMKAFKVNDIPCFALARPKVIHANHSGSPLIYCKYSPKSEFKLTIVSSMQNVFDLDVVVVPATQQVVIAALAQQDTEQIGDLIIGVFNMTTNSASAKMMRRLIRPLKLHLFNFFQNSVQLVVSEAITSNDAAQAASRIYTLHIPPSNYYDRGPYVHENQVIRDNEFYDIQSVLFNNQQTLLFLQSSHSISIYVPKSALITRNEEPYECQSQFTLLQRLPTKGANRFLAYNDRQLMSNRSLSNEPYGHYLVLSKDDCTKQQFSTIILKAQFK